MTFSDLKAHCQSPTSNSKTKLCQRAYKSNTDRILKFFSLPWTKESLLHHENILIYLDK